MIDREWQGSSRLRAQCARLLQRPVTTLGEGVGTMVSACRWGGVVAAVALLLILLPLSGHAQPAPLGLAVHRIDASRFPVVRLYLSVADGRGVPIAGLD